MWLIPATDLKAEQWLYLTPMRWSAQLTFDGRWNETETNSDNGQKLKSQRFSEQFTISNQMHLIDPALASISFDIRTMYRQNESSARINDNSSDSNSLNYAINGRFLQGARTPISLSLGADKSSGSGDDDQGNSNDFRHQNSHFSLNFRNNIFPSTITYIDRERNIVQGFALRTDPQRINDRVERWNYKGRSSKTNLNVETLTYEDPVNQRQYDYERQSLNHRLPWGRGSQLNTQVEHLNQNGFGSFERTTVNENIRIQHTPDFSSSYKYGYDKSGEARSHRYGADFSHRLYTNLSTSMGYQKALSRRDEGEATSRGTHYSLGYNKRLPLKNSSINLGFNGSRIKQDSQLIDAINRSYSISGTGIITLIERNIDISTLVITDQTGTIFYTQGSDYTVTQTAGGHTEIVFLFIPTDPNIFIDFSHTVPLSETGQKGYSVSFRKDQFRVYHDQSRSVQKVMDPVDPGETKTSEQRTGLSYSLGSQKFTFGMQLEERQTSFVDYETRTTLLQTRLGYKFSQRTGLTSQSSWSNSQSSLSNARLFNTGVSLNTWLPDTRISLKARIKYWRRNDGQGNQDNFTGFGLDAEWRYYFLELKASYQYNRWSGSIRDTNENRLLLTVSRRSR